jgi:hypothetical protein
MAEIAALVAAVGGVIFAGVGFGTRYINTKLHMDVVPLSADLPIVRARPAGRDRAQSQ